MGLPQRGRHPDWHQHPPNRRTAPALAARVEQLEAALRECEQRKNGAYCSEDAAKRQDGRAPHSDDLAVDRFAAAMKAKLAQKRAEGRSGWDDPTQCTGTYLRQLLRGHTSKGDPVDVGNLAMMLWNRGERT